MEKRIAKLEGEIARTGLNSRGRRMYSKALKASVARLAIEWKASGRSVALLAQTLGLGEGSVASWVGKAGLVKPIEVEREQLVAKLPANGVVVVLTSGVRIEGLGISEAIELGLALG